MKDPTPIRRTILCSVFFLVATAVGSPQDRPLARYQVLNDRILHGAITESIPDVGNVAACAARCDADGACRSFTYIPSKSICELKTDNRFQDGVFRGYVSGISTGSKTAPGPNGAGVRALIAGIATGMLRESVDVGSHETPKGEPELEKISSSPDGTASGFSCQQKTVRLEQQAEEFITLDPTQEWLYPGAVLQGATIKGGTPTWVGVARSPGRIALALQTGALTNYVEEVQRMDRLSAVQAVNNILSRYDKGTPGEISITYDEVHSQEHLEAMLGANVSGTSFSAGAKLNVGSDTEKTRMLVRIVQKFYTMVFEPPRYPEDVFAPDVTARELSRWVGPGNPPVYVSSVNYGRMLFAILESDLEAKSLAAAFNAAYNGVVDAEAEGSLDYKKHLASTKITMVSFGASGAGGLTASADTVQYRNFDGIYDFLRTSGDFSDTNPGVPISYQMRSLYDSRPVRLAATTEYTKNVCTPVTWGCDDKVGSGKVEDQCGVCDGNNACQRDCPAVTHTLGNDYVFVYFDLPKTKIGQTIKYDPGQYAVYRFPRCYHVVWSNVRYTCEGTANGGVWKESQDWGRGALCHSYGDTDQPNMRVVTK